MTDVVVHPVALAAVGLCAGLVGATVGAGGGVLIVPYLLLAAGLSPARAAAASLVCVAACALSAMGAFERKRAVDHSVGLAFLAATIPGAVAGTYLAHRLSLDLFALLFAGLLLVAGASLVLVRPRERAPWPRRRILAWGVPASLAVGVASSLLGVGGGVLHVPLMLLVFGMAYVTSVATSQFVIVGTSLVGAAAYAAQGGVDWRIALPLAAGSVVGAQLGARAAQTVQTRRLRILLALVLLGVAGRLVAHAL